MLRVILNRGFKDPMKLNPFILGTTTRSFPKGNNKVAEYLNGIKQDNEKMIQNPDTVGKLPMSVPKNNWLNSWWNAFTGFRFTINIKNIVFRKAADGTEEAKKEQKLAESDVSKDKPSDKALQSKK